jgi:Cu-processing system ATP-binding protein
MSDPCVVLDSLTKCYGRQPAVDRVHFALHPGECVALVGHNGAGKSTIIKLMLGLIRPTAGRAIVLGADPISQAGAVARRKIGYLPEHLSLQPSLSGEETLAFYARLKRLPTRKNAGLLEQVGIANAAHRRVGTYSKGMRQRLGLAQALLGAPALLLFDEPTSGLDPALRLGFYEIVGALRANGAAILISSHALAELQEHVDRVVIMSRGRKVADGTIAELRRLARRPVRIQLTLAEAWRDKPLPKLPTGVRSATGWRRVSASQIETRCTIADKMALIESLAALPGRFADIEILSPSLDETYAHFLQREVTE